MERRKSLSFTEVRVSVRQDRDELLHRTVYRGPFNKISSL